MSSRSFDIRFFYFFNSIINKLICFYKKNFDKNIKNLKNSDKKLQKKLQKIPSTFLKFLVAGS
jgi:hypothetical protein